MDARSRSRRWAPGALGRSFGRLGDGIVRHPRYTVLLWGVILVVAVPAMMAVGTVITNSFGSTIPSSYESVVAQNELAAQFPNSTQAPTSALVLLEMPNVTGPVGRNVTLAIAQALSTDPKLEYVRSIASVYSAYGGYLAGQATLGLEFLGPALRSSPSLPESVNQTASLLWGPAAAFEANWLSAVQGLPAGAPPGTANWVAFNETRTELASEPLGREVLGVFYDGFNGSVPGFNATVTSACLTSHNITPCVDASVRATLPPLVPTILPGAANATAAAAVLTSLGVENLTCGACIQGAAVQILGPEVGLAPAWLLTLWQAFPSGGPPSPEALAGWASAAAVDPAPAYYLPPLPAALAAAFVSPSRSAALIVVSYSVSDEFSVNGTTPTYANDVEVDHVVSSVLASAPAFAGITFYVTGASPLGSTTTYLATSALGTLLTLTIVVLIAIMVFYFRAPAAPVVSFTAIGVALVVSLAVVFLLGKLVTPFNPEVEPVLLVFLMSVGTDYSVFLMARYREELVKGASSNDAVRTTVRWAGQSITTSGLTVMVVSAAMTFAPFGVMQEFGWALTFGVLVALLVSLTLVPAILCLVGPRVFWPYTGERFQAYAKRRNAAIDAGRGYIATAGRVAVRRPWLVLGVILLLSAPVVYVALEVPVGYDITNIGIPSSEPTQQGFVALSDRFGPGYASPSYLLVTFSSPLIEGGDRPNLTEIRDLAALGASISSAPGVAAVSTLVGPGSVPLSSWENFSSLPPAPQAMALASAASYLGVDGRTVQVSVTTNASGFSADAVSVLGGVRDRVSAFRATHPEVGTVHYGGAAPTTQDLRTLVDRTNLDMLVGAAVGLFLMLLLVLGSAFVPALALGAIGLSILWGWAGTYFVVGVVQGEVLIFILPLILLIMILGLGMDYNVLLLTRVREERERGGSSEEAVLQAVTHAGGVIAAAAVILGGAFLLLGLTSPLGMLAGIGLGIGVAVLLQAFVVQMYLTPAVLALGRHHIWKGWNRAGGPDRPRT